MLQISNGSQKILDVKTYNLRLHLTDTVQKIYKYRQF